MWIVAVVLWSSLIALGARHLLAYEMEPGPAAATPSYWPKGLEIARPTGLPKLVMFAHPQCPCTAASLGELALLMAQCEGRVDAHVIFFAPESPTDWRTSRLRKEAGAIRGVSVDDDREGETAARFGVSTSGHTLLFNRDGVCVFSGGMTAARGHAGDNTGRAALTSLLSGRVPRVTETPVYGCSIF